MLDYRELPPSPALADRIECFWTMNIHGPATTHRVLPDGCSDLILTIDSGRVALDAVGPMTVWRDYPVNPGRRLFGVRFHPGRGPLPPLPDSFHPLEDRRLLDRLANAATPRERASIIEASLPAVESDGIAQAIAQIGRMPLDDLARAANLSSRQFRRVCEARTGYTPKLLARILRFRRASTRLSRGARPIDVALACGYYDQSHLINEFRILSGRTPVPDQRSSANSSRAF